MSLPMPRLVSLTALFCLCLSGCIDGCHDEHRTSRSRTLQVDEHGHVHDPNDGHDHGHGPEKRISSH